MPSRILYDTRDNSILRCQAEPKGSARMPSIEGLCRSARVPDNELEYMESIIIEENMLTQKAKKQLRIIDNEVFEKPKCEINLSSSQITAGSIVTADIEITNTLESDVFSEVNMQINDVDFIVPIIDNEGSKNIELTEADTYKISCVDDRFLSQPVKVEVV
jgi:hypothetical protein